MERNLQLQSVFYNVLSFIHNLFSDTKKITPTSIPILTIELWQGKMKEYWQSNKVKQQIPLPLITLNQDVKICSVQVPLNNLMDDKPYENFIQLPRGILHISMIRVIQSQFKS